MGLKLEVGTEYVTEDGRIVRINSGNSIGHFYCTHADEDLDDQVWLLDGSVWMCKGHESKHRLARIAYSEPSASNEPTGPVRTVTRKEIVFGVHGDVEIVEDDTHQGGIGIYINATMNAARIRAAANNMLAVADAMEDQ